MEDLTYCYLSSLSNVYETICNFLTDFENSTNDKNDDDFLSDGQWLDEFYHKMVEIKNELEITLTEYDS